MRRRSRRLSPRRDRACDPIVYSTRHGPDDVEHLNGKCRAKESTLAKALVLAGATWPGVVCWDDRRTIDYLATRPEVDAKRIGCLGISMGGYRSLYLAAHAARIIDWPVPEGRLLLRDLMEHATQPEFVYRHAWQVGDLVIWDNRATMHRARPFDDGTYRRELRRVTTLDVDQPSAVTSPS